MVLVEIKDMISRNTALLGITIAVVATFVNQLVFSFINDIIMPIIDRDGNNDNEPDINRIANYIVKINGMTFKIGAFILALIRFILVLFFIFIVCLLLLKYKK
jgi:large-conductance mechanosensitive channel